MRKDAKELGLRFHPDELLGPGRDSFPNSRSHLAPDEFSPITSRGTNRLNLPSNSLEPQISDNWHRPK